MQLQHNVDLYTNIITGHQVSYDTFVRRIAQSASPLRITLKDVGVYVAKDNAKRACAEGDGYALHFIFIVHHAHVTIE